MFNNLGTKLALRQAGLGNVKIPSFPANEPSKGGAAAAGGPGFANPFAGVQWNQAFSSWKTPPAPPNPVAEPPKVGARAPSSVKLKFPAIDGRPVVVIFLRYCGCPFTQKLFLHMRSLANRYTGIHFIAISHCTPDATAEWTKALGGAWNVDVVVDQSRELYAAWGLAISSWAHLLNPRNGYSQVMLGKTEGVWGQKVGEGGCRWQTGGAYAVDAKGIVQWGGPMASVDEHVVLEDGCKALGFMGKLGESRG
ncbi:hypothetical protein P280DRAFT_471806 [Massarina eburnea CBS 473.64]|uniref:Thioredoxin domain-containing protein n=1 Tax=Massarina eburnea CBS 473.64 TaxID=1395130 RepID=A0A6A6RSQ6_9PLEO|nr:hypothetical protein P280DRAFT_471806 [Massarina eburnea CBS 473.64]